MTATAGAKTRKKVANVLQMQNVKVIKLSPDNPNCKFIVQKAVGDIAQQFTCLAMDLKEKTTVFPRTVVYCMSIASCGEIFSLFREELGCVAEGMYAMYHSRTPKGIQEKVLFSLASIDGLVRIGFATNALGMGIKLPDIRRVIHYGIPRDTEIICKKLGGVAGIRKDLMHSCFTNHIILQGVMKL